MGIMPSHVRSSRRKSAVSDVLVVDGLVLHVTRKAIKNMYLRIKPPGGEITVSAPLRMSDAQIVAFARARRPWIVEQRRKVAESGADAEPWTDERRMEAAEAINAQLPALLERWGAIIGRSPTHITLRVMTTRWGSCTPRTGRIRLNLRLGLMDPKFLEYVLVHEMTHLWASGHGAEFQRRMTRYLPNWRQLRSELNHYAAV